MSEKENIENNEIDLMLDWIAQLKGFLSTYKDTAKAADSLQRTRIMLIENNPDQKEFINSTWKKLWTFIDKKIEEIGSPKIEEFLQTK